MNLLLVSGVALGGASRSTRELAEQLARRGHSVDVLLGDRPELVSPFGLLVRCHEKTRSRVVGRILRRAMRAFGARFEAVVEEPGVFRCRIVENAVEEMLADRKVDIVVVNSVPRIAARLIGDHLANLGVPFALYLREAHAITHFSISRLHPDLVLANAQHFVDELSLIGVEAHFVPSIVNLDAAKVGTSRQTVVMVNPIAENRRELFRAFAQAFPERSFVLQESWPLGDDDRDAIDELIVGVPNLEFRLRTDSPADVYRDTALLVAPYPSGRPRVVLEAQANGIPVVGLDQPGIAELASPGDTLVPEGASDEEWLEAITPYLVDAAFYADAMGHAQAFASRDEVSPAGIVDRFEAAVATVVEGFDVAQT